MLKKIDVSYDKDLREPYWKMLSNKMDDGMGNPVILYQEIWEV